MRGICSAETQASCPLLKCRGSDLHHTQFPAKDYTTKIEKSWRDQPFNKVQIERCGHQAIHASGYIPEKPTRDIMLSEIWGQGTPLRAMVEKEVQLQIAERMMGDGESEVDRG